MFIYLKAALLKSEVDEMINTPLTDTYIRGATTIMDTAKTATEAIKNIQSQNIKSAKDEDEK